MTDMPILCRESDDGAFVHIYGASVPEAGDTCECGTVRVGDGGWNAPPSPLIEVSWNPHRWAATDGAEVSR